MGNQNINENILDNKEIQSTNQMKKRVPLYFCIAGIVVVLLFIFIVSLVVMANSEEKEVGEPPKVEEKEELVDLNKITNEEVIEIYNGSLPFIEDYEGGNIYSTEKVSITNADKRFLRSFAFSKIEFKEGDLLPYLREDGTEMCDEDGCTHQELLDEGWYRFSSTLLQEKAKYYYGTDIENGSFNNELFAGIEYVDNMYKRSVVGGKIMLSSHYREFVSFEVIEDTLFVYDKYLYIYGENDDRGDHLLITVYGDSMKKNKLGSAKYMDSENLVDFIVPTYERKKANYKHTFKKAEDGHLYWISSEPVI